MTLQQLFYLVTVADCGNITEAAEKLFISQPSLSAAIHNLENEMGLQLSILLFMKEEKILWVEDKIGDVSKWLKMEV